MQKLFENWRRYLQEGSKQAADVGYVVLHKGGTYSMGPAGNDSIQIELYDGRESLNRIGNMFLVLLDWDEEEEDQSIDCGNDVWVVASVKAQQGFGPLLYDIALEYIYNERRGVIMSGGHGETTGDVTVEAARVWHFYFKNRNDVHKDKDPRCSDVLSPWILKNPQLKPYHEALMHVYYKDKDIILELEEEGKIEYK